MSKIRTLIRILSQGLQSPYFGFVQGHSYLSNNELKQIKSYLSQPDESLVTEFEFQFARLIGSGEAISFASGRMGFYAVMKTLGVTAGDEVVLLGATCSVMVNAVLRIGATPIFSDVDPNTFGSSAFHIEQCLTPKTRLIVAQHSFGILCEIEPIVALAKSRNIFILEDCALTLDSTVNGISVGNFSNAALFSTDHSKPINTLTGGLIYTRNSDLASRLRAEQSRTPNLPISKQQALWRRFLLERKYCCPSKCGQMELIDVVSGVQSKLFKQTAPFLSEDFQTTPSSTYPYPAKLPIFLAAIGLQELKRWPQVSTERKQLLIDLLEIAVSSSLKPYLPKAYFDKNLDIIPLRFAWTQPNGDLTRNQLSHFINVSWTWFLQPIIATKESLENFGYHQGTCPISERLGLNMVNLPCNLALNDSKQLVRLFQSNLSQSESYII